ncbi:AI-2E family transporter [Pseudoroseicyclus tamaricis]|uniref:AI-2E family transporter n=1 Tax=Pseudoroseicyclus tamaricis TaxID=2705421 RepID=A0A6B2JXC6_9RHOB|nr:AI-2E family transporter [Pseudoroseicyclus tamaricis]NDV00914.1 AI-2E family transporter [Pseudoroseicyclus tamaricis]
MALPVRNQLIYWGIGAIVIFLLLWALGNVILPFVLAGAIAYLLDPIADRLQRLGFSRILAVVTITLVAVLIIVPALVLLMWTLIDQTRDLIATAPEMFGRLQAWVEARFPELADSESQLSEQLRGLGETVAARGGEMLQGVMSSAAGLVNLLVLVVIVPVVTFYLLIDWDRMVARVNDLLPLDHAPTVRALAREIDRTLASFIRGQGLVCLILGSFYAIALMLLGLNFGLAIGAFAGLITFIPYVGAVVGGVLSIGVALFQFWGEWWWIGAVAAVFVLGQFVEGNILTPNLVGSSVGLHPVWLLLALSVFGALFGFVGMLVAVPVAAAMGVVVRFFVDQYRKSLLYMGVSAAPPVHPGELVAEARADEVEAGHVPSDPRVAVESRRE